MHLPASQRLWTAVNMMQTCPRVTEMLHADHVQILPLEPVGAPHLSDEHRVRFFFFALC